VHNNFIDVTNATLTLPPLHRVVQKVSHIAVADP